MWVRVLGSAAGGGLPQWNCACTNCETARRYPELVPPRTQSSVGISADGDHWFLLNVSPDIRHQVGTFSKLGPRSSQLRSSRISGCVLTDAELDHTSGLLLIREGGRMNVYSTAAVRQWLSHDLGVERVLQQFAQRTWITFSLATEFELHCPDSGPTGLRVQASTMGDNGPRYAAKRGTQPDEAVVALLVEDRNTGGTLLYAPCVEAMDPTLDNAAKAADCVLLDGTFWTDDEMIALGTSDRSAKQMGHVPISGAEGSLAWFAQVPAKHRSYIHINNTNPILHPDRSERREVESVGIRIAEDGDEYSL